MARYLKSITGPQFERLQPSLSSGSLNSSDNLKESLNSCDSHKKSLNSSDNLEEREMVAGGSCEA